MNFNYLVIGFQYFQFSYVLCTKIILLNKELISLSIFNVSFIFIWTIIHYGMDLFSSAVVLKVNHLIGPFLRACNGWMDNFGRGWFENLRGTCPTSLAKIYVTQHFGVQLAKIDCCVKIKSLSAICLDFLHSSSCRP